MKDYSLLTLSDLEWMLAESLRLQKEIGALKHYVVCATQRLEPDELLKESFDSMHRFLIKVVVAKQFKQQMTEGGTNHE